MMTGEIKDIRVGIHLYNTKFEVNVEILNEKRKTESRYMVLRSAQIESLLSAFDKQYVDQLRYQPVIIVDDRIEPDLVTYKEMTEFEGEIFGDYEYIIERVALGWGVEENDDEYGYQQVGIWPTYDEALQFVKSKGDYNGTRRMGKTKS